MRGFGCGAALPSMVLAATAPRGHSESCWVITTPLGMVHFNWACPVPSTAKDARRKVAFSDICVFWQAGAAYCASSLRLNISTLLLLPLLAAMGGRAFDGQCLRKQPFDIALDHCPLLFVKHDVFVDANACKRPSREVVNR